MLYTMTDKGGCKVGKKAPEGSPKGGCKEGLKAPLVTGRLATKKTKVQRPPQKAKVVAAKPRVAKVAKVMKEKPAPAPAPAPASEKKTMKDFNNLRSFLNDYRSVDGTGIKKVDETDRTSQVHRKLRDYTDKFDNLMLRKAQAKKERPFTEKQQNSIMDAINYIKDKFGLDVRKGKTGLIIK